VLIYDEAMRIEPGDHLLVSYPCVYDLRQRRITAVDAQERQQYRHVQAIQLMLWAWSSHVSSGACHGIDVQHGLPVWGTPCKCACLTDWQDYTSKSVELIRGHFITPEAIVAAAKKQAAQTR
jgi:hypothetical protein